MSTSEKPPTAQDEPTFSLNGLMRYLHRKPAGRARITADQKRPGDVAETYYDPAADAIGRFIEGGMRDESILAEATSRLASASAREEDRVAALANIEAVEAFQAHHPGLDFHGLTPSRGEGSSAYLRIAGVKIVIRPEIILGGTVRGVRRVGALKLYLSKSHPLSRASAEFGAALVRRYCEERVADGARVRPQDCSIFVARTGEVVHAPASFIRRMEEIEAACEEIALRWPNA